MYKLPHFYYTLEYELELPNENDITFVSMCLPYTYTRMLNFLKTLENQSLNQK